MKRNVASSVAPRVFMMDLWATVPYYTAYLSRALLANGTHVQVGSITYYLDQECFRGRGLKPDPGLSDVAGRFPRLPKYLRRALKFAEGVMNVTALSLRFLARPPDVVHVQFLPMLRSRTPIDRWFVNFCRKRGSRVVLTVHDLLPHDTEQRYKDLYAKLYAEMDGLICHSDHVRERLENEFGIAPERISVIPHGPFFYDLPEDRDRSAVLNQLGVESGRQMVLWQGIIFPYKGLDLLLDAWQLVEQQRTDLCLVAMGTGAPDLTAGLEARARTLGLNTVRFHFRFCSSEELVAAYRAASFVVYPYRAITTSGALATGLSLGKAIIASDLPVFREMLTDGKTGLLVNPSDRNALAGAIIKLAADPELRTELSRNVAEMRFGQESWSAIAAETLRTYQKALDNPLLPQHNLVTTN